MEKNNEKDFRIYAQPETEEIEMNIEGNFCQTTLEPGEGGGELGCETE